MHAIIARSLNRLCIVASFPIAWFTVTDRVALSQISGESHTSLGRDPVDVVRMSKQISCQNR